MLKPGMSVPEGEAKYQVPNVLSRFNVSLVQLEYVGDHPRVHYFWGLCFRSGDISSLVKSV